MTTATTSIERVLDRLRGALGTGETPPNSNHNFITVWYNATVDKIGDGAWCEMTNTWSCWTGGAKALKKGRAYTVWAAGDAVSKINQSSWHYGTAGMRSGDHVYFDWKGGKLSTGIVDHTGTVEKILGDGTFYTLEGNSGNVLKRQRRDGKYVVGYVRLDWDSLGPMVPTPKPPVVVATPKHDTTETKKVQALLHLPQNGRWDRTTDTAALMMRTAARAKVGYPKRVNKKFNIKLTQVIAETTPDNVWGPRSQTSISHWVKNFQKAFKLVPDGDWGPRTDNAFLAARKRNLNT